MFIMAASIHNTTKCKVQSIICFLHGKGERPVDSHKEVISVYGNMNRQNITKSCHAFSRGRNNVHEEHRKSRPYVISDAYL